MIFKKGQIKTRKRSAENFECDKYEQKKVPLCVSDRVPQFVHIFLVCPSPFTLSNILTWEKHICFPTSDIKLSIRQIPQTLSLGFPSPHAAFASSLHYQTKQSAKNDGHALAGCSCGSHSFCLCFTAAKKMTLWARKVFCVKL